MGVIGLISSNGEQSQVVIVEIKNLPARWGSLDDKDQFLAELYQMMLNLADELKVTRIQFVGEIPTLH